MDLQEALGHLDPKLDTHWTADGLPRVDVVQAMIERDTTRDEITAADPEFNRQSAALAALEEQSTEQPQAEAPTADPDKVYGRTWLYSEDCPGGQIFDGDQVAGKIAEGWTEQPPA